MRAAEPSRSRARTAALRAGLAVDGVGIQDGFLGAAGIRQLMACAEVRRARGGFADARIGAARQTQRHAEIRGDQTCWLAEPLLEQERALCRDLDGLRLDLNREGLLGLWELEMHYAWYPPGAGYARHIDQFQGRDERVVSLILYLNAAWSPEAGGELRLFDAVSGDRDIEPLGGRLVCFLAAAREHAVLPTRQGRLSLTGWFRHRGHPSQVQAARAGIIHEQ